MKQTTRCAFHRPIDARHEFDSTSGWCVHGCGARDDGMLVRTVTGKVLRPGPTYTEAELATIRARLTNTITQPTIYQPTLDLQETP